MFHMSFFFCENLLTRDSCALAKRRNESSEGTKVRFRSIEMTATAARKKRARWRCSSSQRLHPSRLLSLSSFSLLSFQPTPIDQIDAPETPQKERRNKSEEAVARERVPGVAKKGGRERNAGVWSKQWVFNSTQARR